MRINVLKRAAEVVRFRFWVAVCLGMALGAILLNTPSTHAQETVTPEPTVDRLAAPPTVLAPTQADNGAQVYWLHCQPCHGDQGQGLIEDWRNQYPPEDRDCWNSGCHGNRPYEDGFTIPKEVPAVIGDGTLLKFDSAESLYNYLNVAMPFHAPGSLTDDEYIDLTAFLARAHNKWDGTPLDKENLRSFRLQPLSPATPEPAPTPIPTQPDRVNGSNWPIGALIGVAAVMLIVAVAVVRKGRTQ